MLERSRILKRVDEAPGARVIEGYPIELRRPRMPAVLAWPARPRPFGKLASWRCCGGDTGTAAFWSLKPP
jgi:hypothetical protein